MLAQSQGRNEQVVNSYNLFIDSAKDVGGGAGKGDSFSLQLGADSIQAQDGQFLRLTLQEFSMYTNFYMVNINNCRFRLTDDTAATEPLLTQQNYKNVADVAENFATALAAQLSTDAGVTCTPADITPASGTALNATSNRIISFDLDFASPTTGTPSSERATHPSSTRLFCRSWFWKSHLRMRLSSGRLRGLHWTAPARRTSPTMALEAPPLRWTTSI